MKHLKKRIREEEEGFTLIELLVVVIITGVLAAIGIPAWQGMKLKSQAVSAKTVITNIKNECESSRDLGVEEVFTLITPSGYSIQPEGSVSCYGDPGTGQVSAVPNEVDKNPTYAYEHLTGTIITALIAETVSDHDPYLDPIHGAKCTGFRTSMWRDNGRKLVTGCYGANNKFLSDPCGLTYIGCGPYSFTGTNTINGIRRGQQGNYPCIADGKEYFFKVPPGFDPVKSKSCKGSNHPNGRSFDPESAWCKKSSDCTNFYQTQDKPDKPPRRIFCWPPRWDCSIR